MVLLNYLEWLNYKKALEVNYPRLKPWASLRMDRELAKLASEIL